MEEGDLIGVRDAAGEGWGEWEGKGRVAWGVESGGGAGVGAGEMDEGEGQGAEGRIGQVRMNEQGEERRQEVLVEVLEKGASGWCEEQVSRFPVLWVAIRGVRRRDGQ